MPLREWKEHVHHSCPLVVYDWVKALLSLLIVDKHSEEVCFLFNVPSLLPIYNSCT